MFGCPSAGYAKDRKRTDALKIFHLQLSISYNETSIIS